MQLNLDQVKHVAKLANLPLTAEEEEKYANQLSKILDYIEQLNQANTEGVQPTFNVTDLSSVMSEDQPKDSLVQKEALQNAPKSRDGDFVTKGVFEE